VAHRAPLIDPSPAPTVAESATRLSEIARRSFNVSSVPLVDGKEPPTARPADGGERRPTAVNQTAIQNANGEQSRFNEVFDDSLIEDEDFVSVLDDPLLWDETP
jgi:hypothetical protein